MKKLFILLLTAIICLSATACTNQAENNPEQTDANTSTEPIATTASSEPDGTTEAPETDPNDVEPGIGEGAERYYYIGAYEIDYYGLAGRFEDLRADDEDFREWANNFIDHKEYLFRELGDVEAYEDYLMSSDESVVNIENFVNLFDVTKEEFRAADLIIGEKYAVFTEAQVDALFSGDRELIDEQFINPCAIKVNGVIYTPKWIEEHTLEEIKAVGITKDMLADRYDDYLNHWVEESAHTIDLKNKIDHFDDTAE